MSYRPQLLRRARRRIARASKGHARTYSTQVLDRAADLLAEVWAAGTDIGIAEQDWNAYAPNLPHLCLILVQEASERPHDE